ncbi:SDR family NAD(P)-dependent oxidoreductase [Pseudonocardia tropica]|uniref:SDR family NAD(P)-dependent oxidoreductase n=1 Tax=Pseudonocardia tropica TaxID=681289 RepID=A0ABV1JY73_9PSEU
MTDSTIVLVTGANKGLGLTTARRLGALGHTVLLGSRDHGRGAEAAGKLAAEGIDAVAVDLDVTDDASVTAAADRIRAEYGRLDVLVNNAGVVGGRSSAADTTADLVRTTYETNVFGPVRVTHAMLGLLAAARAPRIVMVSSGLGSHGLTADPERIESRVPGFAYQSSKAALNMVAARYAAELPDVHVAVVDPGYTRTDLNGNSGTQTVEEGTDAIAAAATGDAAAASGTYSDRHGPLPW